MKKLLLITVISASLMFCQSPKEKASENSNETTVIGYEFNEAGEKLNLIGGDVLITDIYLRYIQAHNDKNVSKIYEMDTEDIIIKASNGAVFNGRDSHKEQLEAWFASSDPIWSVKWMVANTLQGKDGENESWLTTGVDKVEMVAGNSVKKHHVLDVHFVDGKVKELHVYDRATEQE